ncbi:toll/interleukin-1 receptor domain-containing protein [Mesorhizobium sp. VK4C]|uniref:toll/interleukin-1 receptor domain-containing protein n=1 Tax=Mesorhizobium captivum TaxID=3072319 RepID=UPI002A23D1D9|nr:toll/interleukin-1 receptor domain-containing protein [Mesorhizobium sp. VK4C]MDX8501915.1 toll/interleukin-1 receptor domain-containing protein [Mesorhizobium sp. VK4C]
MTGDEASRISVYQRVVANTVGYDVFIAYRIGESRRYAEALHNALEARGLVAFLDDADEGAGASIQQFVKFACAARCLVVVVTPGVYDSLHVREEVDGYRQQRMKSWRRPFSRMIPINVDQALAHAPSVDTWKELGACVFAPERSDAVAAAHPSQTVVDQIVRSGRFVRATALFGLVTALLTTIVIALLGGTTWSLATASKELASTNLQLDAAKRQERELDAKNEQLVVEGKALQRRNDAVRALDTDPVVAYRLAESAESLLPSSDNLEVIRSVISSGSMLYSHVVKDCTVDDTTASLALLRCKGSRSDSATLKLMDLDDFSIKPLPQPAGTAAWIVPFATSWRLLSAGEAEYAVGEPGYSANGINSKRVYRLFDAKGAAIGKPVFGRFLTPPDQRCSPTLAFIASVGAGNGTIWDLSTDKRTTMTPPAHEGVTLACRGDGARAQNPIGSIRLVDSGGQVVPGSETRASFDYIGTEASWSPLGKQLAIFVHDQGRIGVWDPSAALLAWLDPDGWAATAYAWSPSGQLLSFAGNTEHQLDAIVEVASAVAPTTSRRVVYRSGRPIRSMAFSPDEKRLVVLDDQGTLAIVDLDDVGAVERGRHVGARNVRWTQHGILTSSSEELRVWSGDKLPRENWVYRSVTNTRLDQCAASDTSWRWQAVSATTRSGKDSAGQVLVRDLKQGTDRILEAPDSCMRLLFASNGDWFVFVGLRTAYFWSTSTWQRFALPLQEDDAQYFGAHEQAGHFYLYALGAKPLESKTDILYDIDLDAASGPRLLLRHRIDKFPNSECPAAPIEATAGWLDALDRAKYQSMERQHCEKSPWEVRIWCRDQPLEASDCDIEFVPVDLQPAMEVYDSLMWNPEPAVSDRGPAN